MKLERLHLAQFRNFAQQTVEFGPRFTVLCGRNGAGKTNVLEALYFVGTLRSFRTADLASLVRRGQLGMRLELQAHDAQLDLPTSLVVRLEGASVGGGLRRTAEADGKVVRSAAAFYGRVPAVLFTPEDLNVIRGSPTGRRQFLDRVLFARDRAHIGDVQDYEKLLRSRNVLLRDAAKTGRPPGPLGDVYEQRLAEVGGRIWSRRVDVIEVLREGFASTFARIQGPTQAASLDYVSKLGDVAEREREASLSAALVERRARDQRSGTTSIGPHRDDLEVLLDGQPADQFASQGQTRALVLAFKLAEVQAAHELRGQPPLLLLDDVSSELDADRSAQLFEALADAVDQCIVTTTAPEHVPLPTRVERVVLRVVEGAVHATF